MAKRFWKRNDDSVTPLAEEQLSNLIIEGIAHFKSVVVRLEHEYKLDLRHIVDFSFIDTFEKNVLFSTSTAIQYNGNGHLRSTSSDEGQMDIRQKDTDEVNRYALETIHAMLISLGDLHRYFIEFNFNMPKISKDFAANYYFEAFKLNPKTGMAHNQLGTLYSGQNHDLDSIYHYLYSLVCPVPFELSDINVAKLFQSNSEYLGHLEQAEKIEMVAMRDIIARFILVVDVFFYDKVIADLNSLCHCTLIDFREMIQSNRIDISPDILFKMVAILLFCLAKLQTAKSSKVHHLNAFLVAICSEMVSGCTTKLEKFISKRSEQDARFQTEYTKIFDQFENNVRSARESHRRYLEKGEPKMVKAAISDREPKLGSLRSDGSEREMDGAGGSSGNTRDGGKSSSSQNKIKKKQKVRRRRKRMASDESDSDMSNVSHSDFELDTDFSSDSDSDDDGMNSSYSTDGEDDIDQKCNGNSAMENQSDKLDSEDIVIEEEELVYLNGNKKLPYKVSEPNHLSHDLINNMNALKFELSDGGEDLIIEDERLVYGQNGFHTTKQSNHADEHAASAEPEKLRFKQKYCKLDPNIIVEFMNHDHSMQALKILFDWLRINSDILVNCFATNPEFIDKIFGLLNLVNIDIFTRKVYFVRKFIKTEEVREDLRSLFDGRTTIPLSEDVLLKELSILDQSQHLLNWTMPLKLKTTGGEESILRIFKLVDFGFFICKIKQFRYNFCSRNRSFVKEEGPVKRRQRKRGRPKGRHGRRRQGDRDRDRDRDRNTNRSGLNRSRDASGQRGPIISSNEEPERSLERQNGGRKKGYLKNRGNTVPIVKLQADVNGKIGPNQLSNVKLQTDFNVKIASNRKDVNKHELMGKLWLQHEIETLEAKISKTPIVMTPYLVVDIKSLVNHLPIVKDLMTTRRFVILIPNAGRFFFV